MTYLDLRDNDITSISNINFDGNSSALETLDLRDNTILTKIDEHAFDNVPNLKVLRLGNTGLTSIPLALKSLPNLAECKIDSPQLQCTCEAVVLDSWWKSLSRAAQQNIQGKCGTQDVTSFLDNLDTNCPAGVVG